MRLSLTEAPIVASTFNVCPLADVPVEQLAELMLAAYRGTPDDEGETLEDTRDEIGGTLAGQYGPLDQEASAAHYEGDALASALIITEFDGGPFVPYVFTRPAYQQRGHAGSLLKRTAQVLRSQGRDSLDLAVTVGGPGERLYEHLGFRDVSDGSGVPGN